ncbi:AcrR family transcriptional regulator [Loktanella ponticola]|uniref:AcrR family transcriptional regulator n=1 Tax=Yoonia ponticola TaxID=1524255 RepID=A0A7W9BMJ0_9RHOB|nr:TetR/AcrR family transcriptional regulator [Yoonia ponticola]MBB5723282.1 AcrR family transcriptional regulator [Yoonia ponticola]
MARKQGSHSDITGPKVRAAALRLIARHGCAAVSMRQIAAEVGVQAGALYNYTSDKQTLLFDLMRRHMEKLLAAYDETLITGTPTEQLRAFTLFHIRYHLPRRDEVFVSYMELRNLSPENFLVVEGLRRNYEDALEGILKAGEADGSFTLPDRKVTVLSLIAQLTGITNWYRDDGRLTQEQVEDIYCDLVLRTVSAPR